MPEVVDYRGELPSRLIDYLVNRDYSIANMIGEICTPESIKVNSRNAFAIAEWEPSSPPKEYLFGLIKVKARRHIIARIWTNDEERCASHDHLVVEAKGAKHLPAIIQLFENIEKDFGVEVKLFLVDSRPEFEYQPLER